MDISPSVYEHAAFLIGRTPWETSRNADLLFQAHAEAYRTYRHAPIMPGIDIYNLEAEAYGATIEAPWETGIPAVRPMLSETGALLELPPFDPASDGRIPMQIAVAARLKQTFPEADIRVPIAGPFSIATNLVGFNRILLEAATDPALVRDALLHLVDAQVAFARAVTDAGVDVTFFESAACPPMLSPSQFREIELPALTQIMTRIAEVAGRPIPCIIGGNTFPIVEPMLETGTGYLICPFETDQPAFLDKVRSRPDVRVRVNCDLRIVQKGPWEALRAEADRVIALVKSRENTCFGTGSLAYDTPSAHVLRLMDYVRGIGD